MEGLVMIYATISRHALKGQKLLAQGSALGNSCCSSAPCKGKSFKNIAAVWKLLPLQGDKFKSITKPRASALGYELLPFQGVWGLPTKVLSINIKRYNDLMVRGRLLFLLH